MGKSHIVAVTDKSKAKPYLELNAKLAIPKDGRLNLRADKDAVRSYFIDHVNTSTRHFKTLAEKFEYLLDNEYLDRAIVEKYTMEEIKHLYKVAHSYRFRFRTFMGARKFYTQYALKSNDKKQYLGLFEDQQVFLAMYFAQDEKELAEPYLRSLMERQWTPATPTLMNAMRARRGELTSCFLLTVEDNANSIRRALSSAMALSRLGGGVSLLLSNMRENKAPIKGIEGAGSGVVPFMKSLENAFSYFNQLG